MSALGVNITIWGARGVVLVRSGETAEISVVSDAVMQGVRAGHRDGRDVTAQCHAFGEALHALLRQYGILANALEVRRET